MTWARINGHTYPVKLFVFDKDGLMFESRTLRVELARAGIQAFRNYTRSCRKNCLPRPPFWSG